MTCHLDLNRLTLENRDEADRDSGGNGVDQLGNFTGLGEMIVAGTRGVVGWGEGQWDSGYILEDE